MFLAKNAGAQSGSRFESWLSCRVLCVCFFSHRSILAAIVIFTLSTVIPIAVLYSEMLQTQQFIFGTHVNKHDIYVSSQRHATVIAVKVLQRRCVFIGAAETTDVRRTGLEKLYRL